MIAVSKKGHSHRKGVNRMDKIKILLVEDDPVNARIIQFYLSQQPNQEVVWVESFADAIAMAGQHFDLLLLDILLPDADGIILCQTMRETTSCPIIFMSCLDDEETIIRALETGGDDFIPKPFSSKILQARIDANLRRVALERNRHYAAPRRNPDFSIDMDTRVLFRDQKAYPLTPIEFGLLIYLMEREGQVVSSHELYEYVWAQPDLGDLRTVTAHIHTLRKKLERDPGAPVHLRAIHGKGYYYTSENDQAD